MQPPEYQIRNLQIAGNPSIYIIKTLIFEVVLPFVRWIIFLRSGVLLILMRGQLCQILSAMNNSSANLRLIIKLVPVS